MYSWTNSNAIDNKIVPNKELSLIFVTFKEMTTTGEGYFFVIPFCENLTFEIQLKSACYSIYK